jgi:hypothetical protein
MVKIMLVLLRSKNVNFFIVKVLVKSNKGGWEVTLIYFIGGMRAGGIYHCGNFTKFEAQK